MPFKAASIGPTPISDVSLISSSINNLTVAVGETDSPLTTVNPNNLIASSCAVLI